MAGMTAQPDKQLSQAFAALADPTRRWLIEQLSQGERCIGELAKDRRMTFAGVSKHIRVLEDAGLLNRRVAGRQHFLSIDPQPLRQAHAWINLYRDFWQDSFDRLEEHLRQTNNSNS